MAFNTDQRYKCAREGCKNTKGRWECDVCGRKFCQDHVRDLHWVRENYPEVVTNSETIKNLLKFNVRTACHDCLALGELKEIEDTAYDQLPLLMDRFFLTETAQNYYHCKLTGEKSDPHLFDFGLKIIKDLVEKIKKEEHI